MDAAGRHRCRGSLKEVETVGRISVIQMRNRNYSAHSQAFSPSGQENAVTPRASGWQGSHKAASRGDHPRSAPRKGRVKGGARAKRVAQAAGWTVGVHVLPMYRADRMESLKVRKTQYRAGGIRQRRFERRRVSHRVLRYGAR